MRLIDADAAIELLRSLGSRDYRREKGTIADAMKMLSHSHYTPTIDPEELRPKGRWEFRRNKKYSWCTDVVCTACETIIDSHCDNDLEYRQEAIKKNLLYCPHCGAKMED